VAADGRDHHVLDAELDGGVRRVDRPNAGWDAHNSAFGLEFGWHQFSFPRAERFDDSA
jgi:hypothetical protein